MNFFTEFELQGSSRALRPKNQKDAWFGPVVSADAKHGFVLCYFLPNGIFYTLQMSSRTVQHSNGISLDA
eukprot:7047894-Pyramimonas_sp.AAC.1